MSSPGQKVSIMCCWGRAENNSRKNEEIWAKAETISCGCVCVKVKSDVIKNDIAWEPGILGPRITVS